MGFFNSCLRQCTKIKMSSKDPLQSVVLNLELSHWCSVKDHIWNSDYRPVTSGEPTHDWEFKIQDGAKADMRHYIEKIVIKLHESFAEPVKEFTKPPFVVRESGYGNFEIVVDIFFKGFNVKDPARKTQLQYNLFLQPSLESLRSGNKKELKRENTYIGQRILTVSHKDPGIIKRLVKGGGVLQKSNTSSLKINTSGQDVGQHSSSGSISTTSNSHKHSSSSQKASASSSSSSKTKGSSSSSSSSKSSKSEHHHHRESSSHHHHSSSKSKSSHERDKSSSSTTPTASKSSSESTKDKAKKPVNETFKNLFGEPIKRRESSSKTKEVKDEKPNSSSKTSTSTSSSSSSKSSSKSDDKKTTKQQKCYTYQTNQFKQYKFQSQN